MNKCNYKKYSHNNLAVARRFSKPLGFENATEYFKNFVNF